MPKRTDEKKLELKNTVCRGCRQDYYNWPHPEHECWNLAGIRRGKCASYHA